MKKNSYVKPRTLLVNAGIENFIMGSLVNDGNGNYHQDVDPSQDPDTGDDGRAKYGFWDL